MNPFEALGLAYRAHLGDRIVVVLSRPEQIRGSVHQVAAQANHVSQQVTVITTGGEERVEIGRGEVVFTFRKSKRTADYQADHVLTDAFAMSDTELAGLEAMVAGRGQVITR
jgi:small nuclear ribonucleoprotein (snRNP)-like protein